MNAERWGRLVATLADHAVEAKVTERRYTDFSYGHFEQGTTRLIVIKHPEGGVVEIHDRYGRMGKWYGWIVWREGRDGICGSVSSATKKRSEVVDLVVKALS